MKKLKQKVATIMNSRGSYPLLSLASLLHAGSLLYGRIGHNRQLLFDKGRLPIAKLPCPVISIGNITVGGTGKTPMTLHLAQLLGELGCKVVVLSRGYKGAGEKNGAVVSDGCRVMCNARQAGDEPYLMANVLPDVPVVVGRDRAAQGAMAFDRFDPDVILLDDGFQHRQLARDINILLLDGHAPFGNSFLLPRGNLREPISAVSRADVVVYTRCLGDKPSGLSRVKEIMGPRPIFFTEHRSVIRAMVPAGQTLDAISWDASTPATADTLADRRVAAFSGLAHNKLFWESIPALGGSLAATVGFDDHHAYQSSDLRRIVHAAQSVDCGCLVTTEKDLVRMPPGTILPLDLMVLGISIDFADEAAAWRQFIADRLNRVTNKLT